MGYVVVLRGHSGARFAPGQRLTITAPRPEGPAYVSFFTRYVDEGYEHSVPRGLCVEVRGKTKSIDAAMLEFSNIATFFVPFVAFGGNIAVSNPALELAFDDDVVFPVK